MKKLENKVALVTASTRGIGYAIAETFAREGAIVYMACRNLEVANEKAAALNAEVENEGRLDILVNNFGGTSPRDDLPFQYTNYEKFAGYIDMHLSSVFIASQEAIRLAMEKQKSGCIINIGSVAGITPDTSQVAYGTSKAAIIHLSKMIALHAAKDNITCNVVCPGMTATEAVMNNLTPEFMQFFLKHTPIARMATPQEMADAALYFATAPFTTGQVLAVHGGFGLGSPVYGDMLLMNNKR